MDSIENIDPQFRLDAEVAPVYKCTNYDSEERTFEVFYNDGTLKNDEWYGLSLWISIVWNQRK